MRLLSLVVVGALLTVAGFAAFARSDTEPPKDAEHRERIVPVVMVKPGESKELLLSTWCHLGITRGGGLGVGEMLKDGIVRTEDKTWKRDGLTVQVPAFGEAEKAAAAPAYAPLAKRGLNAFVVKVNAAKDTAPGLYDLHLVDSTCSGHCSTDLRVLVVAP